MPSVVARAAALLPGGVTAPVLVATGGPLVLLAATGHLPPLEADGPVAWLVWFVSLAAGIVVFVVGLLGSLRWAMQRGLVSWTVLKRLRVVLMAADGSPFGRSVFALGKEASAIAVRPAKTTASVEPVVVQTTPTLPIQTPQTAPPAPRVDAAPVRRDPESADNLALRPPRSRNVPPDVWIESQRETWCKARASLIIDGRKLLKELQAVPFDAPPSVNDKFHPRMIRWENAFLALIKTYWEDNNPQSVVGVARAAGSIYESTAIGPEWARTKAGLVGAPLAWLEDQPNDCLLAKAEETPKPVEKGPVLVLRTDARSADAQEARKVLADLADKGDGYAHRLRALELDASDDGYLPEDEVLVKDAEQWMKDSNAAIAYWFAPARNLGLITGGSLIEAMMGRPGDSNIPVRAPKWRQDFVLEVENKVSELRARLNRQAAK